MLISNLNEEFYQKNMVLFIGSNYEKVLSEGICELPWKCIITTSRDPMLVKKVKVEGCFRGYDVIPLNNILYSSSTCLIQLYGDGNIPDELLDEEDEELRLSYEIEKGNEIFKALMGKLDARCKLIIAGYSSENPCEMDSIVLQMALRNIRGGDVAFFGCKSSEKLKYFAQKHDMEWIAESLNEAISEIDFDDEIVPIETEIDTYTAYKNCRSVFIPKDTIIRNEPIAQLLTEERVRTINPTGKIEKSRWFYNFLNDSADEPQWYGYAENSLYYVERNYEKSALSLIEKLLEGREVSKKVAVNAPIVLEGASCSSKSIELGAIAYKIFLRKKSPVIFIKSGRTVFYPNSPEINALEDLMLTIDDSDSRFLIVWDSSSMKNVIHEAKQLCHTLENMGRRFVLVCSSYQFSAMEGREFLPENNISISDGCYFIKTTRSLCTQNSNNLINEVDLFKKKVNEFTYDIEEWRINEAYKKLDDVTDIFEYYYRLIDLIRPNLEAVIIGNSVWLVPL